MVMAAPGLKSQSAYDHCQQRFHMLPLSATCRPLAGVLFLHNGKPGGRIAVASFGVVFIPVYSSRLSG